MKNRFTIYILIIILGSIGVWLNSLKRFKDNEARKQAEAIDFQANQAGSSMTPTSLRVETETSKTNVSSKKTFEVKDEKFESYDELEKEWLTKPKALMSKDEYENYLQMRANSEKEKMKAYSDYHDYMRKKFGDNFRYNISEDQSVIEKKINEKYLHQLLKLIGEEKFKTFLKSRDDYNEIIRRKSSGKNFLIIEF
jgi:hypothetical protein